MLPKSWWSFLIFFHFPRSIFWKEWWMLHWDKKLDQWVFLLHLKSFMQTNVIIVSVRQMSHCAFIFQRDHLKIAQQFFQLVGGSASECGTLNRSLINLMQQINWKIVQACLCMIFFPFQILFLADSAWPPASSSWDSLKMFSYISTQSRLVLLSTRNAL